MIDWTKFTKQRFLHPGLVVLVLGVLLLAAAVPVQAGPFQPGDLVIGIGSSPDGEPQGKLRHFSPSGTLLNTLVTNRLSFEETGPCLDGQRRLFTTNFEDNSVSRFHTNGVLAEDGFATGLNQFPNSCVLDNAGNFYVGLSDRDGNFGGGPLLKFNLSGGAPTSFDTVPDARGTDWIDLADDQCTIYYTSQGSSIKKYNVCTGHQVLPDFCTDCDDGAGGSAGLLMGLRVLPDHGVLVADYAYGVVRRYDSSGAQTQIYAAADNPYNWFFPWAVALDPDLSSFWAIDNLTGEAFKFDLDSGNVITSFQAGICDDFYSGCAVTGLAVVGEPRAAAPPFSALSVTASITADSKVYDGTTAATVNCTLSGVNALDDVQCQVSGATFDTKDVGNGKTVTATVTLTGNDAGIYTLASPQPMTTAANITPAPASVTPNAASKVYGDSDPTFTGTLSGFIGADGITATYSRTAGETVAGSPYTISAALSPAGALDNYNITYNTANFTITKVSGTVTPNTASKTYGTSDPTLTGTLSANLIAAGVTATYSRTAGESVLGGPYAISATLSGSNLDNFAVTYNTANFTITPATPIVTWADPADIYYPTPLTGTQLNATADVPGTFDYTPAAGVTLGVGNGQLLSVVLTPTDNSNYTTAAAQVHINVLSADVSVSQTTPAAMINVGGTATYNVTVAAGGTGASSDVVLTDTLPANLDWTISGPDAASCSPASPVAGGTMLTCNFGAMGPGATRSITLSAVTTTLACGDVVNEASVSAALDLDPNNNGTGPLTIAVKCPAIAIAKSALKENVSAGEDVSYKVVVTAGGDSDSTNVVMTDVLPSGFTWAVTGDTASCSGLLVAGGNTLTCSFGTMAPGEKRTVYVTAITSTVTCGQISNTATVSDSLDVSVGDNSAGPVVITVTCPDVSVAVGTSASIVTVGSDAVYNVQVTANGPGAATDVVLTDVLPAGLTWTVGGSYAGLCSVLMGTMTCNFGTLAAGATRTVSLTATTTTANCGVIKDSASVTASGDTNAGNNTSAIVPITVSCPVPPSVTNVSLTCPKVTLVGSNIMVSGDMDTTASQLVSILYTSPSGGTTTHTTSSTPTGDYSDSLAASEIGKWHVQATAAGVSSPPCEVIVYGKSQGGTFVIGDQTPGATIHATADFWGSQWWKDNVWSGGVNPGVASLKGYLDAVDLPANCGSWSTRPGNSSKPPATIPEYVAVIVSSYISKNGPTIAGDSVAEVVVKVGPGYGPAPGHDGFGEIVAVICQK